MTTPPRFHPLGFDKWKLCQLMGREKLAGILLTSPENVFYTTGYTALPSSGNPILFELKDRLPFFSYIDAEGHVTLVCWGFSAEGVSFGADEIIGFDDFREALKAVADLLKGKLRPIDRLGVESSCPYYALRLIQDARSQATAPIAVDALLTALRMVKSPEEIACLRKSTAIIEQTVSELYQILHTGMSRLDLIQEAKYRMIKNGATGISHVTFSFAQENPEVAIEERLSAGKLVTLDLGAFYNGYASDNRRYAYCGSPPDSLRHRYDMMVALVDGVGEMLIPGTRYADICGKTVALYDQCGIRPLTRFTHVGHNIGLQTEEAWIDDSPDAEVEIGAVINIELYSQAQTGEQIGDEETYVIEPAGPKRISLLPRQIRIV